MVSKIFSCYGFLGVGVVMLIALVTVGTLSHQKYHAEMRQWEQSNPAAGSRWEERQPMQERQPTIDGSDHRWDLILALAEAMGQPATDPRWLERQAIIDRSNRRIEGIVVGTLGGMFALGLAAFVVWDYHDRKRWNYLVAQQAGRTRTGYK